MTQWYKLPRWLRLALAWGGGVVAVMLPTVYAMQSAGPVIEQQPMSTTTVTLLVLVLGAMSAVTAMIGKQYQGLVTTQRSAMQDLERRVAAQEAKIERMETELREARGLHLEAEVRHASALGEAKELARSLEQRIQMLEPLEAKVKVLSEDKRILEELLREKERMLAERRTGTGGAA